jgi:murein DD-endopeptidase MepM/ murein hydrolase activator NlpD
MQYMHAEKLLVKEGEAVQEGQPVILEGKTGRVTGEHLHFGVFEGKALKQDKSNYIDPMTVNVGKYEKLVDTPYRKGDQ